MAIIVIGGQSRNIGKTAVVCSLISAMPERRWTAIKITQCKHDASNAEPCDCELAGRNLVAGLRKDRLDRSCDGAVDFVIDLRLHAAVGGYGIHQIGPRYLHHAHRQAVPGQGSHREKDDDQEDGQAPP